MDSIKEQFMKEEIVGLIDDDECAIDEVIKLLTEYREKAKKAGISNVTVEQCGRDYYILQVVGERPETEEEYCQRKQEEKFELEKEVADAKERLKNLEGRLKLYNIIKWGI